MKPSQLRRLTQIQAVFIRYGLDQILVEFGLDQVKWLRRLTPVRRLPDIMQHSEGVRLRLALEALGPVFIKFGQTLSTRPDLLPDEIATELAKLQDRVPPFPGSDAKAIVEKAYGLPVEHVFASFDEQPLASASIAQVHLATLPDGEHERVREVVVKVLRPGVEDDIRKDVAVLHALADMALAFGPADVHRLRPKEIVSEYEKVIFDELDMLREAANGALLRRNFENSPLLYVPEVLFDYSRPEVLVVERIHGVTIGDVDELKRHNVDMKVLSERGVEIFFSQVFRDNFFHADMHPGNIFVDVSDPRQPNYISVDYGIVGALTPQDQSYLALNFIAFFNRDYARVAELHLASGWVPAHTRADEFEAAIRTVCEPIFNRPLSEISFGQFLVRLFRVARRFDMEVQPQLVLLQKTLLNIEGLGRQLYPELDLWATAKPFLESWMRQQYSPKAGLEQIKADLPLLAQQLPQLTQTLQRTMLSGDFDPAATRREIQHLRADIRRQSQRHTSAMAGAAAIVGASIIYALDSYAPAMLGPAPLWSWILGGAGVLLLLRAWRR